jgi:hypothetical protein
MPGKGIRKPFYALKRNQKPSHALKRNQKAIPCIEKESASHSMP